MPTQTVIDPESVAGKTRSNPSDEGKSPSEQEIEKKVRENLRGEYSRKESELREELDAKEERLAELEEKVRLTEAQKEEKARLQANIGDIETEIYHLENDPKNRAWKAKHDRDLKKTKDEAVEEAKFHISIIQAEDFIEEMASDKGIEPKELRKKINVILSDNRYSNLLPHQRAKKAYRELVKIEADVEERRKNAEEKARLASHAEGAGGEPREKPLEEVIKSGSIVERMKALGLYDKQK